MGGELEVKKRKKKKASTFIIVVVVMAVIFTTGTTILAVTANDYKMRINESKKLQNLYEADSGLDVVENIIIKTSQEAIKYADKEVKKEFTKLEDKDRSKENLNKAFSKYFFEFIETERKVKYENGTTSSENVKPLKHLISNKQIIESVGSDGMSLNLKEVGSGREFTIEIISPDGTDGYKVIKNGDIIESISIGVISNFESTEGEFKNKKTVSTSFKITAPEYNSEVKAIGIYPVFDGKAITADGNMNVTEGNLTVNGDIWIKGNDDIGTNPEYTFDKYKGGIKLDKTSFNINGNIYTANTFHLNNKVESSVVDGNIYAKNVYVGKEINSISSDSNNVTFKKDVVVNNDLALNATKSKVIIENNFYGINDRTVKDTASNSTEKPLTANKALNSSSIIVNDITKDATQKSTITVEKDSYIMGVAYLNATDEKGNKYQTGESVAVKGNYLAYTDVKDVLNGGNNVTLKYYSPLQLLESKGEDSSAAMKAEYFAEYYNDANREGKYTFNDGGVTLVGKVKSVGASVKDKSGVIQKSGISKEDLNIVNEQRNEFARNVFAMGDATGLGNTLDKLYENQAVARTVSDQVNFDKFSSINTNSIDESSGIVILDATGNEIVIENGKLGSKDITKGLIITKGNITIKGTDKFDFKGNIITTGNITFEGSGEKNITYDPQVIRNILSSNYNTLKNIFKSSDAKREEIKVTSASELYSNDKFLTKSLWRIVK